MSIMTIVTNVKYEDYSVWIGRWGNARLGVRHLLNTPIGQKGWLGNPFLVEEHGRKKCIELYADAFLEKVKDPAFFDAIMKLDGQSLGCFCKPLDCHGDIIVEFIKSNKVQT